MVEVKATGKIVFSKVNKFKEKGGVSTYILQCPTEKTIKGEAKEVTTSLVVKEFFPDQPKKSYAKGDTVFVHGRLLENNYKNKDTGEWVKGGLEVVVDSISKV